ncbi:site-specific integrase [Streptomyces xanthophaeus]
MITATATARAARSPFAGADVHDVTGLRILPGSPRPRFEDDVWDMTGMADAPKAMTHHRKRWDFTGIPTTAWQTVAKELVMALLSPQDERVAAVPLAFRKAFSPNSVRPYLDGLTHWFNYLADHGVTSLGQVTQTHCDGFHQARSLRQDGGRPVAPGTLANSLRPVQYLALYGELFSTDGYPAGFVPWGGRPISEVAGAVHSAGNTVPPVPEEVFQPMLAAALHLVQVIGPHVAPEWARHVEHRTGRDMNVRTYMTDDAREALLAEVQRHVRDGDPLPRVSRSRITHRLTLGGDPADPLLAVNVDRLVQRSIQARTLSPHLQDDLRAALRDAVAVVGLEEEYGRNAAPVGRLDDPAALVPWTAPIDWYDLKTVRATVQTACLLLTAAVSGMRPGELLELTGDSPLPPTETPGGGRRYRLASTLVKGQEFGGVPEEWVVVQEAHQAVTLAAALAGAEADTRLFGHRNLGVGEQYKRFREWVNGPEGRRLGLPHIPAGPVNGRMLRRTLAMSLAYRPGGLLAAKIHLKHVSVATTEGYAHRPGGAQGLFLAEVGEAEREHHLELTAAAFRDYQAGVLPAGPGARDVIAAFRHVDAALADQAAGEPKVMDSDRQLVNLLRQQAQYLHVGTANYCWFKDPEKALCLKIAGAPVTADSKPLAGMCDSARCPQATHHPVHRQVWADNAEKTRVFLGSIPRGHRAARDRVRDDLERSLRVLDEIDAAGTDPAREGA